MDVSWDYSLLIKNFSLKKNTVYKMKMILQLVLMISLPIVNFLVLVTCKIWDTEHCSEIVRSEFGFGSVSVLTWNVVFGRTLTKILLVKALLWERETWRADSKAARRLQLRFDDKALSNANSFQTIQNTKHRGSTNSNQSLTLHQYEPRFMRYFVLKFTVVSTSQRPVTYFNGM